MSRYPRIIAAAVGLLLAGCAGTPKDDTIARNCAVERVPVERFSLCLPNGWMAASQQYGDAGSFVVHIHDPESARNLMQIHVKKDLLEEDVRSSMAFARRAVEIARETAPNYRPVSTEEITINGEATLLHIFDASPTPDPDPVRYYQFVTTNGGIAYGFTAVMFPGDNEDLRRALLEAFTNMQFNEHLSYLRKYDKCCS